MINQLRRGWSITQASWSALMMDRELALFPVLSACLFLLALVSFVVPLTLVYSLLPEELMEGAVGDAIVLGMMFLFYYITSLGMLFCNTAILHCASLRFKGQDPTFGDGIRAGFRHLPRLSSWALLSATLGTILNLLERRLPAVVGPLVRAVVGGAWAVVSFFAVPVLIFEEVGPKEALRRSREVVAKVWGEAATTYVGLGSVSGGLAFLALMTGAAGTVTAFVMTPQLGSAVEPLLFGLWGVVLTYLVLQSIVFGALEQIYRAALYQYAASGELPKAYTEDQVSGAFLKR